MLLRNNQLKMVEEELLMLYDESLTQNKKRSIVSVLRDRTLLLPIVLVCCMSFAQQLSGINAVSLQPNKYNIQTYNLIRNLLITNLYELIYLKIIIMYISTFAGLLLLCFHFSQNWNIL